MKRFIVILSRGNQLVNDFIYTDSSVSKEDALTFYELKQNHKFGEVNKFGALFKLFEQDFDFKEIAFIDSY